MIDPSSASDNIEQLLGEAVPTLSARSGSGEYYLPASHIQLLEQLEHLSRYSHFIQVVSGVSGIGKTTLLQQFYPSVDDNSVHACCIQALPDMNADALLAELAFQLNLNLAESATASAQLAALLEHAELLKQISRQLLIVIDDAELLSADAIDLLFNQLSTLPDDDMRPHILLFATPKIRQLLDTPELSDVVESSCHFIDIQPLDNEELNGLLDHRFGAIARRLTDQQKQRILADSLGIPGRVPRVLEALLADKPEQPPSTTPEQSPTPARSYKAALWLLASTSVIALLAVGTWLALPSLLEHRQSEPASAALSSQPAANSDRIRLKLTIDPATPPANTLPAPQPASGFEQRLAQARATLDAEQADQTTTAVQPEAVEEQPSKAADDTTQQLQLAPVKDASPATQTPDTATTDTADQTTAQSATLVLNLPAAAAVTQPSSPAGNPPLTPSTDYYGDGQAILSWNAKDYSLQMLGARQEQSILDFISTMPNRDKLRYFFTFYKGKPWYVVIYGQFPSRAAAMTAIGELPPELRRRRPWARSIKGVQDDIRKGQK